MRVRLEGVFVVLLMAAPASAADLTVGDAWIRALPAKLPAAGYFTLTNTGTKEVTLTGASSAACGMLMLHKSTQSGGMGSMEDVESVAVPAGGSVKFAPGGYHLMCMDPTPAVTPGGKVSVELSFAGGGRLSADFAVKNAQGK